MTNKLIPKANLKYLCTDNEGFKLNNQKFYNIFS